ncbi:hypothetical protein HBA55_24675 [Pseudomaricurvus alkylphenolicus]|jgi:hypothetical protein|uniref:hypothetical protein n=1 Tax=Pseudomaricurvus alkylphenolicus TaxID=1306991 RepID=UPI00141DFAA9|nr:hypothetical protein [Pseudomaricurvus alkylphenolicus]NIB42825.1 hypothetical protein [Pseudomaricurvus alkylphenolicus]
MNTIELDCWHKEAGATQSTPVGMISFRVSESTHLELEKAEEELKTHPHDDLMLEVDPRQMEMQTPREIGLLSDCQLRVYLHKDDLRGHFHLVGHRAADGSLVYSNAVMVDQLG